MLQPVVERKGCEKVLGDMRDCLVETHCWGKCDEEVQRFQECINTKYFEEIIVEPEVEEIIEEPEVKSGEYSLESEGVDTIDEGVVSTSDESGNELIDGDVKTTEEEPVVNEEVKINVEETVVNEEVKTSEESVVTEEVKTTEEEPVVNEEEKTNEEEPVVTEENTEDDLLDSKVEVISPQDEKQEQQVNTDDNVELVDDIEVQVPSDSDITNDDETKTVDKDAFRVKIVSSEKVVEEDENLLFRVTIKPNV